MQGDPTEGALLVAARKAVAPDRLLTETPRIDSIPFESEYQYMATLQEAGGGRPSTIYLKGAVESLLKNMRQPALDAGGNQVELRLDEISRQIAELTSGGQRVLAFARKELPENGRGISHEDVDSGLTFIGLQGMIDPPGPPRCPP